MRKSEKILNRFQNFCFLMSMAAQFLMVWNETPWCGLAMLLGLIIVLLNSILTQLYYMDY